MEKTRLFRLWSPGQNLGAPSHSLRDPHLQTSCPERRQNPLPNALYFPRVEGERVVADSVGFLVFFLLAAAGGGGVVIKERISTLLPPPPSQNDFLYFFRVLIGRRWKKRL